ncbi:MAG: phosphoethanolamine transferase [Duodenibacillus sp.]|nr:phosphoethanolamine transferase [Duodenibacillus sp.]
MPKILRSEPSAAARQGAALLALAALAAAALLFVASPRRAAQILLLPLGALGLAALTLGLRRARLFAAAAGLAVYAAVGLDAGLRGFLRSAYQCDLGSGFVIEAVANTNAGEAAGFVRTMAPDIAAWGAFAAAFVAASAWLWRRFALREPLPRAGWAWRVPALLCAGLLAFGLAKGSWRVHLPPWSWADFGARAAAFREAWRNMPAERAAQRKLAAAAVAQASEAPRTIVLVVGESLASANMGLYGYARDTTPRLSALARSEEGLRVLRDAWSLDASTVPSFARMLTVSSGGARLGVLPIFKAAGWRVAWISNQDDIAIKARYAGHADSARMLNRQGGRSSASMDERLLPELERELAAPAARKLVVVHMIGLHPHFYMRSPAGLAPRWRDDDAVGRRLEALGRNAVVRASRAQYDLGVLYQDGVIAGTLERARRLAAGRPCAWVYLSDHGMETGEGADRAGHSPATRDGYAIPFLVWADEAGRRSWPARETLEARTFRTDLLGWTLLDMAGIRLRDHAPGMSLFAAEPAWGEPEPRRRFGR